MYTLLSGLWKYAFQKDEFFILILGLDNAGKTVSFVNLVNKKVLFFYCSDKFLITNKSNCLVSKLDLSA